MIPLKWTWEIRLVSFDYPSGNIARSEPLCVDVTGMLILDLTVIVCNSAKLVVAGSKKMPMLTRPHVYAYTSAQSLTCAQILNFSCTECTLMVMLISISNSTACFNYSRLNTCNNYFMY